MGTMAALFASFILVRRVTVLYGTRPDYELIDLKIQVKPKWKKTCTPYTTHTLRTTETTQYLPTTWFRFCGAKILGQELSYHRYGICAV